MLWNSFDCKNEEKENLFNGININMDLAFIQNRDSKCIYKMLTIFALKGHFETEANLKSVSP